MEMSAVASWGFSTPWRSTASASWTSGVSTVAPPPLPNPPKLSISGEDSLGERVQHALPEARVVKAFNTIGNQYFVEPRFREGQPTMLIAGDDEGAKRIVGDVLASFGWSDVLDIGGIEGARELEAICIAWVKIGGKRGAWDHGFKLLAG